MQNNLFQWGSDVWLSLDQWGILVGLITGRGGCLRIESLLRKSWIWLDFPPIFDE